MVGGTMYLRRCRQHSTSGTYSYWKLVESVRTARGPRQRVVAYLGDLDEAGRLGLRQAAQGAVAAEATPRLFDEGAPAPRFVEIDPARIEVENVRGFGGPWLALQLIDQLGLRDFLAQVMPPGREEIPWEVMSLVLVVLRLLEPSSELRIAEHLFERTALDVLLGLDPAKVNDDRLYRTLDQLLTHKDALQKHLKARLGELFKLDYDLLLYDVTSTYFEGQAQGNPLARRGYSRDQRSDCKQVCIALVVSRCGMPVGYEVFAGNRTDVTTVEEIVTTMEARYGRSQRIWVMDRGMSSADNIAFLQQGARRYIIGTPKSMLRKYERELLAADWTQVREGLEVKLCRDPEGHSQETFILCRSAERAKKEQAMHARFEQRIAEGLAKIQKACDQRPQEAVKIAQRVGRLLGQNTRAAGAFKTRIQAGAPGRVRFAWEKVESWRQWARLSEGCYLLRSNVTDWTAQDLWRAYMQLTEAEGAFRIHKSDLTLRPVWHQKQTRVEAHILVCFLAYVLWKTLGQWCRAAGLGDEPRKVLDELAQVRVVDVVLHTRCGRRLRRRCIARPTPHQSILLDHLKLELPGYLAALEDVVPKTG
jgi:transposase